jgi:membrane-bound serine protease (ClpP class)
VGVGVAAFGLLSLAAPAVSQEDPGFVDVVEVSGYLDPVLVDFVTDAVDDADQHGAVALVLQLDSAGSLVGAAAMDRLVDTIEAAETTVGVWVGPSSAQAKGDAARIVEAADYAALGPGGRLDDGTGLMLSPDEALARGLTDFPTECDREAGSDVGCASTVGDFVVSLPGVESREVRDGDQIRLEPVTTTRFLQLPLVGQLMHTVASPAVAYLLFVIGMALIVFELFTAGIGVAGVVGAVCFVLGCYGLAVLPTRPLGVALLVLAMFGFAVDIQTGVPRLWTGIAVLSFVVGSLTLYGDDVSLSWITLLVAVVGMLVAMLAGMPAMVRTRFSTPTIGREWMIGKQGVARVAIDPDGVVDIRGAPWRARTNRATPIAAGEPVRVAGIDGLVLEVEPLEGAARDHRDRKRGDRTSQRRGVATASCLPRTPGGGVLPTLALRAQGRKGRAGATGQGDMCHMSGSGPLPRLCPPDP